MKKRILIPLLIVFILFLGAFSTHKFYVSIYQIHYNEPKKSIEITSRIFIDDLNKALEKKYGRVTHLGEPGETAEDVFLMKKYISEQMIVTVNGKLKLLDFRSKEMENNVLICYFKIADIAKIKSFEISNKMLFHLVTEQQNIIQTNIYGKKHSMLLTIEDAAWSIPL